PSWLSLCLAPRTAIREHWKWFMGNSQIPRAMRLGRMYMACSYRRKGARNMRTAQETGALGYDAVLVVLVLAALAGSAQILYGSLVGNVTDTSGGAVPGATVRINQTGVKESRQAQTNDLGVYSFPAIPSGQYTVVVSKQGFATATYR